MYRHEIPGGQLSNLRQQAIALGLGDRFEEIEESYAAADRILGRLVKVTPSSKVVGDLALALVGAGVSADEFASDPARFDIPDSVIEFLRGELGDPPGGWPEPLRTKALAGRPPAKPTQELTPDDEAALALAGPKRQAELNRLLFPGPTKEFDAHRELYGDTSSLSANQFFYGLRHGDEHRVTLERGVELLIGLEAISEPDERGMRTVMCILNGQLRPVVVRDRSIASEVPAAEKADRSNPDHVAAPFAGVVTVAVESGDKVERRTDHRDHRGDEDGGRDHRAKGGHRQPDRCVADRAGRGWRPTGGGELTRIVAGALGGRRIAVPPRGTRPTTDRVRESLFNVLTARVDLEGASVLDLYAGSGALGLEALSRGAAAAVFVESDQRAAAVIGQNITTLGAAGATLRRGTVASVLAAGTDHPVDLVLADPPYDVDAAEIEEMLRELTARGWAGTGTVAVVERAASGPPLRWPAGWACGRNGNTATPGWRWRSWSRPADRILGRKSGT